MKRTLKRRKGETLGEWRERIAPLCVGMSAEQIQEVLHDVSVTSYIEGTNTLSTMRKEHPEWF